MANEQVIFAGFDLYADGLVEKLPQIKERKTFKRDKMITNQYTFEANNIDGFFSLDNPASMLNKVQWLYSPLKVYNSDGILIWDSIVTDIRRNYREKKAFIETRNTIYNFIKSAISYTSSDWETGAEVAKNIMDAGEYANYDVPSLQKSIDLLDANNSYMKVNINIEDGLSMFQAIEKLGPYTASDIYFSINQLYFKHWQPFSGGVTVDFNYNEKGKRPKSAPLVSNLERELFNDYSIGYNLDGGVSTTDIINNDIGNSSRSKYKIQSVPEMKSSEGNQIVLKDLTSAVYVGEQLIKRGHKDLLTDAKALIKIQFDVDIEFRQYITLDSFFKMTFDEEGWIDKVFEVFEFSRNEDNRNINIVAYEAN